VVTCVGIIRWDTVSILNQMLCMIGLQKVELTKYHPHVV
jgi:hypothetical protein